MTKLKILIADDHPAIRKGVRNILSAVFQDTIFGEATDVAGVLSLLRKEHWDVLILDIDFPGRNGFDVLMETRDNKINIPVLVFSFHREEQIAIRALRAGAAGFLSKDASDTELVNAIRMLLLGRKYVSPFVSDQMIAQLQSPEELPLHEQLASREYQTMILIGRGLSVSQVAGELNLSISTISTYRARVLRKLMLKNNAELVQYVYRNQLL